MPKLVIKKQKTKIMISGLNFKSYCKWNLCPRYEINFQIDKVENGDYLFMNLDYFESFVNYLSIYGFDKKVNLVTHNSDRDFTQQMFIQIEKYIVRIFPINSTISNIKIGKIPIGIPDKSIEIIKKIQTPIKKENLAYLNFSVDTHPDRKNCTECIGDKDWIRKNNSLNFNDFYEELSQFKYSICPRGAGIDTHRIWESIYLGVIPIIKRNELSDLYEPLPLLQIDEWNDLNYDLLLRNYEELSNKIISFNKEEWINPTYWM